MATRTTSGVADANSGGGGVALKCPVCHVTVTQPSGTRRTICPHCGNFYDPSTAVDSNGLARDRARPAGNEQNQQQRRLPHLNKNVRNRAYCARITDVAICVFFCIFSLFIYY